MNAPRKTRNLRKGSRCHRCFFRVFRSQLPMCLFTSQWQTGRLTLARVGNSSWTDRSSIAWTAFNCGCTILSKHREQSRHCQHDYITVLRNAIDQGVLIRANWRGFDRSFTGEKNEPRKTLNKRKDTFSVFRIFRGCSHPCAPAGRGSWQATGP